jgi:hypothetical protein
LVALARTCSSTFSHPSRSPEVREHVPENTKVEFLIHDEHGGWDPDVVRAVFEEEVAAAVPANPPEQVQW